MSNESEAQREEDLRQSSQQRCANQSEAERKVRYEKISATMCE